MCREQNLCFAGIADGFFGDERAVRHGAVQGPPRVGFPGRRDGTGEGAASEMPSCAAAASFISTNRPFSS